MEKLFLLTVDLELKALGLKHFSNIFLFILFVQQNKRIKEP